MGGLTTSQQREARRLQQRGLTLSEIAARIGTRREAVTLLLYGGVAHWAAPMPADEPVLPSEEETLPPSEGHEGEEAQERIPDSDIGAEGSAFPLQRSSGVSATPPDSLQAKPESSPPAGAVSVSPAALPPQPAPSPVSAGGDASMASSPALRIKASARYVLVDDLGEWLHQSGRGRTRERRWRWEGTGAQLEVIRQRLPHLRELTPEEA